MMTRNSTSGFRQPIAHLLSGTFLFTAILIAGCGKSDVDWPVYLGDAGSSHYASLDQINRGNVGQLEVAWTYRTGDVWDPKFAQIQTNPIVVRGVLYGTSPKISVFALDAATGRQLWRFDPSGGVGDRKPQDRFLYVSRGVTYWADGDDRRILFAAGPNLFALDARTGKPVASFGKNGSIDLHEGLGPQAESLFVAATTPGIVYKNLIIIGSRVSEGADAAPGFVRAFDVRSGRAAWTFHTIPRPGEFGHDTWPADAWKHVGGANSWAGMSLDAEKGIVFIPTGSASFDFWGGNRKGANLFANSLLALDAATGRRIWHFQTVHHDVWDRDLPAPPNLVDVTHEGRRIPAVAQITKSGYVFLFDRATGRPLFPVEERPVPASDLQDEEVWPTQPFPTKPAPFARQRLTEADVTNISPQSHAFVLDSLRKLRSEGQFVPFSTRGTIIFPGFDGGGEWGGAAVDPRGVLYVNANEMPWVAALERSGGAMPARGASLGEHTYAVNCASCHGDDRRGGQGGSYPSLIDAHRRLTQEQVREIVEHGRGFMPSFYRLTRAEKSALVAFLFGLKEEVDPEDLKEALDRQQRADIPYTFRGYHRFVDPEGYPAVKPPWGTLSAIDLNTGEYRWRIPLGDTPALRARGLPQTGAENYGGPIVTAGGLVFIAATRDAMFRAFDADTGALLWQTQLPAGGYATPSTYSVDGRQYVVVACGGGKMGTPSGDTYIAFALPARAD